jgi:hypothetical protein
MFEFINKKNTLIVIVVTNKTDHKIANKQKLGNHESLLKIEPCAMQSIIY